MRVNHWKACVIVLLFVASLFAVLPIQMANAQTAAVSVTPQESAVGVGQTFSVHIQISNVQNLYAVDISLTWSTTMLRLVSNQSFVGVANGVLNAPVLVVQDTADQSIGTYNIIATSENPAGPFSGTATVATLTFTATKAGQSALTLKSSTSATPQLASYAAPGSGDTSVPISATVNNGNVVVSSSTSSTSPSPSGTPTVSSNPTSSTSSVSPTPTPSVPELSAIALVAVAVLVASAAVLSVKLRRKTV